MTYDSETDNYTCKNNKKLKVDYLRYSKTKTGYKFVAKNP